MRASVLPDAPSTASTVLEPAWLTNTRSPAAVAPVRFPSALHPNPTPARARQATPRATGALAAVESPGVRRIRAQHRRPFRGVGGPRSFIVERSWSSVVQAKGLR